MSCSKQVMSELAKAVESVAVGVDGGVLDAVEMAADLFGGVDAVVEVGDEAGDGPLEVDVVLPERVVGVDEQGLVGRVAEGLARSLDWGGHRLIIKAVTGGLWLPTRSARMPRLGDVWPRWRCDRLEAMINAEVARLERTWV